MLWKRYQSTIKLKEMFIWRKLRRSMDSINTRTRQQQRTLSISGNLSARMYQKDLRIMRWKKEINRRTCGSRGWTHRKKGFKPLRRGQELLIIIKSLTVKRGLLKTPARLKNHQAENHKTQRLLGSILTRLRLSKSWRNLMTEYKKDIKIRWCRES